MDNGLLGEKRKYGVSRIHGTAQTVG